MNSKIWLITIGFLGMQYAYGLQNSQASRVFQLLGTPVEQLSLMWLLAPLLSLIALPLSGYQSDRYFVRRGTRVPFIVAYTIVAFIGMVLFPRSATMLEAIIWLALMDLATQLNFEQNRAFTTEVVDKDKTEQVFVWQSFYICLGATIASVLPYIFDYFPFLQYQTRDEISPVVRFAFTTGALTMIGLILYSLTGMPWRVTKVWSNRQVTSFLTIATEEDYYQGHFSMKRRMFKILKETPPVFLHLCVVQFFSWLAFVTLWIYFIPAVTQYVFGATDVHSKEYYHGANWAGVCFAAYNFVALIYSLFLKRFLIKFGRLRVHVFSLMCGAIGLLSLLAAKENWHLLAGMVGVGLAWASLMAVPYNIVVDAVQPEHRGFYLNLFSYCISLPKIAGALLLGIMIGFLFGGEAMFALILSALFFMIASLYMIYHFDKFRKYDRTYSIQ